MLNEWWNTFLETCDAFVLSLIQQDLRHIERINDFIDRMFEPRS